jgi:hypothetical protein
MDAQGRPQLIGVPKAAAKPVAQGKPKKTSVKKKTGGKQAKGKQAKGKAESHPTRRQPKRAAHPSPPSSEEVSSSDSDTPIRKPARKPAPVQRKDPTVVTPKPKPAPVQRKDPTVVTPKPKPAPVQRKDPTWFIPRHETGEASYLTNFPQKFLHIHEAIPAYFYGPLWHKLVYEQQARNRLDRQGDYTLFKEYLAWVIVYAREIAKTNCKPVRQPWPFPGPEPEPWSDSDSDMAEVVY